MPDIYLVLKTLHIVAMVAWFAGLFYAPRLFVYHVESEQNEPSAVKVLATMERKLLHYIMLPAALATWGLGLALLAKAPYLMSHGWVHAKLGLVLLLSAYHASLEFHRLNLAHGHNTKTSRFFRLYNEVPTVLLLLIVALAVIKPF
jgi:protoporphyrinogen IX oxidase